jgi:16S rRNA processing protein RimM
VLQKRSAQPLEIGAVTRAHGLRGDVRVRLHWSGSDTLEGVRVVLLRSGASQSTREFSVHSARRSPQGLILKLDGVDDRDSAEALRGSLVSVPREFLPQLDEGEYYLSDLVDAEVRCEGEVIGVVESIRLHPSVDCLVILTGTGKRVEQPVVSHWLESVDVDAGVVLLSSRDGLIE